MVSICSSIFFTLLQNDSKCFYSQEWHSRLWDSRFHPPINSRAIKSLSIFPGKFLEEKNSADRRKCLPVRKEVQNFRRNILLPPEWLMDEWLMVGFIMNISLLIELKLIVYQYYYQYHYPYHYQYYYIINTIWRAGWPNALRSYMRS